MSVRPLSADISRIKAIMVARTQSKPAVADILEKVFVRSTTENKNSRWRVLLNQICSRVNGGLLNRIGVGGLGVAFMKL